MLYKQQGCDPENAMLFPHIFYHPSKDIDGKFKLGVFVKNGINGIGTITYITNSKFASLGHPVYYNNEKAETYMGKGNRNNQQRLDNQAVNAERSAQKEKAKVKKMMY